MMVWGSHVSQQGDLYWETVLCIIEIGCKKPAGQDYVS